MKNRRRKRATKTLTAMNKQFGEFKGHVVTSAANSNLPQIHSELIIKCSSHHSFDERKKDVMDFPPTYKYEMNCDTYVGGIPKEEEKKRSSTWCDHILDYIMFKKLARAYKVESDPEKQKEISFWGQHLNDSRNNCRGSRWKGRSCSEQTRNA
ncbi:hypothetical protein PTKIN_Ptkin19aG0086300 [Pterospermum kingtungense]